MGIHGCFAGVLPKPDVLLDDRVTLCSTYGMFVYHNHAKTRSIHETASLSPIEESETQMSLTGAIRFGSKDSVDIDLLYAVPEIPSPIQAKQICSGTAENRNLMVVNGGVIVDTYKGLPDETNNALFATYDLHSQDVPNPVERTVQRIVPLKVLRCSRMILSFVTHTEHRVAAKDALKSNNLAKRHEVLAGIDFTQLELTTDRLKSIAFQLAQTNALIDGIELYSKAELQAHAPTLAPFIARRPGTLGALNDARDEFLAKLAGVYVRQKGNLNLLMYGNALAITTWNQYARQCRGMILDVARERCIHFPMDKFFRFGEGPEVSRDELAPHTAVEIVEKVDGSMVSLVDHDGAIAFSCKGNFDTEQSQRALEIAQRLPMDRLRTDRYWHVFEVIYPENRFPQGLGVVDYGDREDLVLISMRDRWTNELLPYGMLIEEARRVGVSHPCVFEGSLRDAFAEIDNAEPKLGHEGFVIHSLTERKYFKLKYEGYKEVLRLVNDLRSRRFVRRYVAMSPDERQQTLEILPDDIRSIAADRLSEHAAIVKRLSEYVAGVCEAPLDSPQQFAEYVMQNVREDLQRIVFQFRRGIDCTPAIEKVAVEIYEGQTEMPQA